MGADRHWSDLMTSSSDPDLGGTAEEVNQASIEMGTYGFQLACERKDQGGDDLISLLINQEVEGHQVSEMEFASLFIQLTVAGNETTRGLISSGMYELLKRPALYLSWNPTLSNCRWRSRKCCAGPARCTIFDAPRPATPRFAASDQGR